MNEETSTLNLVKIGAAMKIVHTDFLFPRALSEAFSCDEKFAYIGRLVIVDNRVQVCGQSYPIDYHRAYKTLSFKALNPHRIGCIKGVDLLGSPSAKHKVFFVDTSFTYAKSNSNYVVKEASHFTLKRGHECKSLSKIIGKVIESMNFENDSDSQNVA